ncbi:C-type lectin domain family 9 member A-like [Hemitrygon akajei]|uniref:C-type lectin domain family 9 member A-like n=1 Tax=Hemitrygon akajei TaxID=2704970 RepID=UPI003BF95BD6
MGSERPAGRDRSDSSIWLICVLSAALIVTGICWRIHVSQIRHQFTEMETKYRSVNEVKAQICELLTSRKEQGFPQNCIRSEGPCYFISTDNTSYDEAKQYCSKSNSKLLEINSADEENFVTKTLHDQGNIYWIGKCKDGKVASNVMFRLSGGDPECGECGPYTALKPCDQHPRKYPPAIFPVR